MKSVFNKQDVSEMRARIERLTFETPAKWGKFNPHQMLCHLQDQMSYALGMKEEAAELIKGPPMFIRALLRLYLPWPKGKVQTVPAMLETQPKDWEQDVAKTIELMERFPEQSGKDQWPNHPFFGPLKGLDWAKLVWRHNDHHLTQFGV